MNWQRNPHIKTTLLPDGYAALTSDQVDWVHVLNPVGALVWELSDGNLSTAEIIAQIEKLIQSTDKDALRVEVDQFAQELLKAGVLHQK